MVADDVVQTFENVRSRLFARIEGLTDAEYLWEPVPGCMTVRAEADGVFRTSPRPWPETKPAPFTTIGWRMWHIGADCLRGYGRFFTGTPDQDCYEWPGTAKEGTEMLAEDWSVFVGRIRSLGDERLLQPMGELGGRYGHESYLLLALHA
ncbi:MAG TPA: DinB family protein, partial [Actinospica sp.]|nr:DinB family protein [Actinospica sp.]